MPKFPVIMMIVAAAALMTTPALGDNWDRSFDVSAKPGPPARVEVLKDVASTSAYGMRGANGVIIIHTKK